MHKQDAIYVHGAIMNNGKNPSSLESDRQETGNLISLALERSTGQ
jgi:hypothetical protein